MCWVSGLLSFSQKLSVFSQIIIVKLWEALGSPKTLWEVLRAKATYVQPFSPFHPFTFQRAAFLPFYFFTLLPLFFSSCDNPTPPALSRADSLKYSDPAKALRIVNGMGKDRGHEDHGALIALCKATATALSGAMPQNDSLAQVAVQYYSVHGDSLRKAEACYAAALTYRGFDDQRRALDFFQQAGTAMQGVKNGGLLGFMLYRDWGLLMKAEPPYTDATAKLSRAYGYASAMGDKERMAEAANLMGYEQMFAGDMKGAYGRFKAAASMALKAGARRQVAESYKNMAVACNYMGLYAEALGHIDKAMACGGHPDPKVLYSIKGSILAGLGRLDEARRFTAMSRKDGRYYDLATYYMLMYQIEKKEGNLSAALDMHERYALYLDSTYEQMRSQKISGMQRLYDYSTLRAERNALKLESSRLGYMALAAVALTLLVAVVAVLVYLRAKARAREAMALKDNLMSRSIARMKERNYELMKERQKFRDREAELSSSLMGKDEEIGRLRQRQQELKMRIFETDKVVAKIERTRSMNESKKIMSSQRIMLSEGEKAQLVQAADLCFDGFVERLKADFPTLSDDDLCLCCLMRMGVSNQDICILLGIGDYTLRKRKYRMKKVKMNGEEFM